MLQETTEPVTVELPPRPEGDEPRRWRGVNLLVDPRRIGDDELAYALNFWPVNPEVPSKRGALAFSGGTSGYPGFCWNAMCAPFAQGPLGYVLGYSAAVALSTVDGGAGINIQPLGGALIDRKPCFAPSNGSVYCVFGSPFTAHAGVRVAKQPFGVGSSGGTVAAFGCLQFFDFTDHSGNIQGPNPVGGYSPQVAAPYNDRMVYANFGPGYEQMLLFSDSLHNAGALSAGVDPLTCVGTAPFAANGRGFFPGNQRIVGDRIVGLKEIMLTQVGGAPQRALLVLMETAAFLVTGEPNQTTDNPSNIPVLNTLNIQQIAYNCGCSSQETIVTTPYGTFWAGPDDVWMFQYGQVPVRVGSKIRPVLKRTPGSLRYRWHAAYFDGSYRLALDSAGAAMGRTANGSDPACGEQWWLDLRNGPPIGDVEAETPTHQVAEWWGPQQFIRYTVGNPVTEQGTRNLFVDTNIKPAPLLATNDAGGGSGIFTFNCLMVFESGNSRDVSWSSTAPIGPIVGTEILADVRPKEVDNGDARRDKLLHIIEAAIYSDVAAQLLCDIILDGGYNVDTAQSTVLGKTGVPAGGLSAGAQTIGGLTALLSRQTKGVAFWPGLSAYLGRPGTQSRDICKSFQLRLYDQAGYSVVQGFNDQVFTSVTQNGALIFQGALSIPFGVYTALALAQLLANTLSGLGIIIFNGITLTASQNASTGVVTLTMAGGVGSANITFTFQGGGLVSNQLALSGQLLLSVLGFDITGTNLVLTNGATAAPVGVFQSSAPLWELSDFAVSYSPIPRAPS